MNATPLAASEPTLGSFLRQRRARLKPVQTGGERRRTPGLRREEVATRAGVSITWYTWLEQGRGGPPSDDTLERLSHALELDADGREILYLLARRRRPPAAPSSIDTVTPALQAVLDALPASPAFVKTPTWDIVAWNAAAAAVLTDYGALSPDDRNLMRRLFCDPVSREILPDWEDNARFAIAVFRMDVARIGGCAEAARFADELASESPVFRDYWNDHDARSHGSGVKRLNNPVVGPVSLQYSAFRIDGSDTLSLVVFTPSTASDAKAIARLVSFWAPAG